MATLIKLKRRNKSGSNDVVLSEGEPYYNTYDKRLYIGNKDGEEVKDKKHIAQITEHEFVDDDVISFQIGEDGLNTFTKSVNNVSHANSANYVTSHIVNTPIKDIFNTDAYGHIMAVPEKLLYEYNRELNIGDSRVSYRIGYFPKANANITLNITCTHKSGYISSGTVVIATGDTICAESFGDIQNKLLSVTPSNFDYSTRVKIYKDPSEEVLVYITCAADTRAAIHLKYISDSISAPDLTFTKVQAIPERSSLYEVAVNNHEYDQHLSLSKVLAGIDPVPCAYDLHNYHGTLHTICDTNSSKGENGQVLTSDGKYVYWHDKILFGNSTTPPTTAKPRRGDLYIQI